MDISSKPELQASVEQLRQLNERTRWYSTRLWQEPLSYFGIAVLALSRLPDQDHWVNLASLGLVSALVFVLSYRINEVQRHQASAVEKLREIEERLGLDKATPSKGRISHPLESIVLISAVVFFCLWGWQLLEAVSP